jgi:hypothetical protein
MFGVTTIYPSNTVGARAINVVASVSSGCDDERCSNGVGSNQGSESGPAEERRDGAVGTTHMYTGERYQTGPDGLFAHGFMYWEPIVFDNHDVPQQLKWADNFTLPLLN